MQDSITLEELWTKCRGLENSFRYYADIIAALGGDAYEEGLAELRFDVPQELQKAMSQDFPVADDNGTIPTHCPPWCRVTPIKLMKGLDTVGDIAMAVTKLTSIIVFRRVGDEDKFEPYVSERPGTSWHHDKGGH
jgi:hypothetical protein